MRSDAISRGSWVWRFVVMAVALVMLAAQAAPARSGNLALREGLWVGESMATASLGGTVEGTRATFDAVVTSEFTMFVDDAGVVDGDWILDGLGVLEMSGAEVNGFITYNFSGDGALDGDETAIRMHGDTLASGIATITSPRRAAIPFSEPGPLDILVELSHSDCFVLEGDWIYPLDRLAEDADWTDRDIDGYFYAAFFGDQYDELLAQLEQLWADQHAWANMARETGNIDHGDIIDLWARATVLAHQLAEADECILLEALPGEEFRSLFNLTLAAGLYAALSENEVDGLTLQGAALAVGMIRPPAFLERAISSAVQRQAERIFNEGMASDGATCDPCVVGGDPTDLMHAAISGAALGHTYDIDGHQYGSDRIGQAIGLFEWATDQ